MPVHVVLKLNDINVVFLSGENILSGHLLTNIQNWAISLSTELMKTVSGMFCLGKLTQFKIKCTTAILPISIH